MTDPIDARTLRHAVLNLMLDAGRATIDKMPGEFREALGAFVTGGVLVSEVVLRQDGDHISVCREEVDAWAKAVVRTA